MAGSLRMQCPHNLYNLFRLLCFLPCCQTDFFCVAGIPARPCRLPYPVSGHVPDLMPSFGLRLSVQKLLMACRPAVSLSHAVPFPRSNRSTSRPFNVRMGDRPRVGVKTEQGTPAPLRQGARALLTPPLRRPVPFQPHKAAHRERSDN